jgi:hypothetical protein
MDNARNIIERLADALILTSQTVEIGKDIVNEFWRTNKEWNNDHIGKIIIFIYRDNQ